MRERHQGSVRWATPPTHPTLPPRSESPLFSTALLALVLVVSPAHAGKKKDAAPPPPPVPAAPAAPAIDPAFEADIRRLLAATGAAAMGQQVMDQMITTMAPMAPQLPPKFWDEVRAEFRADGLIDLIVPIYAKHLGHEDVKALITFYESPAGKKLIAAQPALVAESMQVGQAWGEGVAQRVVAKMQAQQPQ